MVNYNTRDLLRVCLASVRRHEPTAQLIVVDNQSRDGSCDMVRAEFPEVTLIDAGGNLGFAGANNLGLAAATGEFLVLLNSDAELLDNTLSRCAARLHAEPELGAVHPHLIGVDGVAQLCEYRSPTLTDALRIALRRQPREPARQTWLAGTALVIRRTALEAIGGRLDDGYFMYWEDADLSASLQAAGWHIAVEPTGLVRHHGGASGGGPDASRRTDLALWYQWGRHRWYRRHRPGWEAVGLGMLEASNSLRHLARGLSYRGRWRAERAAAGVIVRVLLLRLRGQSPPRPG